MRLKLLACKVLQHEIGLLMAQCANYIDVTYIRQDFHETPVLLRAALQEEIDKLDADADKDTRPGPYDAILLGYGLCSNAVTGLKSAKHKLVIPKAHDCITILLGSSETYDKNFNDHPGTYWYSTGWVENAKLPSKKRLEEIRQEYIEIYGEEHAPFLMEMEHSWIKDYKTAAFINWRGINAEKAKHFTKECAESLHWDYRQLEGSSGYLADFLNADWAADNFLVLEPGQAAEPSYDSGIIRAK